MPVAKIVAMLAGETPHWIRRRTSRFTTCALAVTRVIRTQLYNVTPTDPGSFAGVAIFLGLMALVASYVPARRAMAVEPIVALRNE